ncbi:MAG TPA: hypothetical protein VGO93_03535 [Candidatus Xenobia bacterium]|jgi:hypothetical protein
MKALSILVQIRPSLLRRLHIQPKETVKPPSTSRWQRFLVRTGVVLTPEEAEEEDNPMGYFV